MAPPENTVGHIHATETIEITQTPSAIHPFAAPDRARERIACKATPARRMAIGKTGRTFICTELLTSKRPSWCG
jgi:hypothetical protein